MKLLAASVFAIGLSLAAMTASKAMPVAPLDQSASADIIRVFGGCGYGGQRRPPGGGRPLWNCPPPRPTRPCGRPCGPELVNLVQRGGRAGGPPPCPPPQ